MDINFESLALMGKFAFAMLGLLIIVLILAQLTPWAANQINKLFPKKSNPERVQNKVDENSDVSGIYDVRLAVSDENIHQITDGDVDNGK